MVYVPDNTNYKCFVIQSEQTIRAYKENPRNNANIDYRDYYFNANYLYRDGTQSFGQYTTLPVCLPSNEITTDFYYRNDLAQILTIFLIIVIFGILLPIKIFSKLFKRGGL